MKIVGSTADILAIIGGATTFVAAVFAAIRLSRCQRVTCCWGAINVVNKPIPSTLSVPPIETLEKGNSRELTKTNSLPDLEMGKV
jgi:hypothetical protein